MSSVQTLDIVCMLPKLRNVLCFVFHVIEVEHLQNHRVADLMLSVYAKHRKTLFRRFRCKEPHHWHNSTDPVRPCTSDVGVWLDHLSPAYRLYFRLEPTLGWLQSWVWIHWRRLLARPWESSPSNQFSALPTEGGSGGTVNKPLVLCRVLVIQDRWRDQW